MRLGIEAGSQTLDIAVKEGIRGVPIFADDVFKNGIHATMTPILERNLTVCQIGAFNFNPLLLDERITQEQGKNLQHLIKIASEEIGCPYIVICGGNYHPSGFLDVDPRNYSEETIDLIAEKLEPHIQLAEAHGVKICIEPYLKTAIFSPERFLALKNRINSDSLRINIDVTSFFGYWDICDSSKTITHVCSSLIGHYGLCHIKEISMTGGFHIHIDLSPIGTGNTDWEQVLRLTEPNLPDDSWVILEHIADSAEASSTVAYMRQISKLSGICLD